LENECYPPNLSYIQEHVKEFLGSSNEGAESAVISDSEDKENDESDEIDESVGNDESDKNDKSDESDESNESDKTVQNDESDESGKDVHKFSLKLLSQKIYKHFVQYKYYWLFI